MRPNRKQLYNENMSKTDQNRKKQTGHNILIMYTGIKKRYIKRENGELKKNVRDKI